MKSKLALTLVLSLFLSVTLPNITAYASTGSVTPTNVSQVSMGGITGMNYADSVGYYLEKEIPQGPLYFIFELSLDVTLYKENTYEKENLLQKNSNYYYAYPASSGCAGRKAADYRACARYSSSGNCCRWGKRAWDTALK